uniref:Fucosyltransferase n=1 Tax=Romanomermis culicivorax TaxID=13658 RepID=A0A915IFU9_ROMCU
MGAPKIDYLRVAPPDSFIHVDDFESPARLAKYLIKLDNNDTLYNEYFRWKMENRGRFVDTKFWCRLCGLLNRPRKKVYADVARWWHGADEEVCVDRSWRRRASEWYGAPIIVKPLL